MCYRLLILKVKKLWKNIGKEVFISSESVRNYADTVAKNINDDIVQQKSYSDKYLTGVLFNFDKNINIVYFPLFNAKNI